MAAQQKHDASEEKMVLAHDPVKGYRPAFYITFTFGVLYLAYVLFTTL